MITVQTNSSGVYVEYLTLALLRAGYFGGVRDTFDEAVRTSVLSFQNDKGLIADGIAGQRTWDALMPYLYGYQTIVTDGSETIDSLSRKYNTTYESVKIANPNLENDIPTGTQVVIPYTFDVVSTRVNYTYEITNIFALGIAKRYPSTQKYSGGKSVMGRDLITLEIGNGDDEIFFNASHHANEWITTPVTLKYAEELSKAIAYGDKIYNFDAKELTDGKKLYIMPLVNPDGVDLVTGGLIDTNYINQTKQIAQAYPQIEYPSGWKANILGTDLNLNYPANWIRAREIKFAQGYTTPAPRDYVGTTPLSAPEALAVYDFTLSHDFELTLSYHTQGEVIYWKYADYQPEDSLKIANELSRASGYELSLTPPLSSYAGYKDWFISYYNLPGYTIEAGKGENPLPIEDFDNIYPQNEALMTIAINNI